MYDLATLKALNEKATEADDVRDFVVNAISTYEGDPAASDFQRGYLACLVAVYEQGLGFPKLPPHQRQRLGLSPSPRLIQRSAGHPRGVDEQGV